MCKGGKLLHWQVGWQPLPNEIHHNYGGRGEYPLEYYFSGNAIRACFLWTAVVIVRVSYRISVWEGEIFFKEGKPKLNHALNA